MQRPAREMNPSIPLPLKAAKSNHADFHRADFRQPPLPEAVVVPPVHGLYGVIGWPGMALSHASVRGGNAKGRPLRGGPWLNTGIAVACPYQGAARVFQSGVGRFSRWRTKKSNLRRWM